MKGVCINRPVMHWGFRGKKMGILFYFFFNFYFYFILLYNTVLVWLYIDMNQPRVYVSSQSWTPLPPPTPYHLYGSSPCTSPKHPVSCIEHRLALRFLHDSIHVSMPFSQIIFKVDLATPSHYRTMFICQGKNTHIIPLWNKPSSNTTFSFFKPKEQYFLFIMSGFLIA